MDIGTEPTPRGEDGEAWLGESFPESPALGVLVLMLSLGNAGPAESSWCCFSSLASGDCGSLALWVPDTRGASCQSGKPNTGRALLSHWVASITI